MLYGLMIFIVKLLILVQYLRIYEPNRRGFTY